MNANRTLIIAAVIVVILAIAYGTYLDQQNSPPAQAPTQTQQQ